MLTGESIPQNRWLSLLFGLFAIAAGAVLGVAIAQSPSPIVVAAGVVALIVALVTVVKVEFGLFLLVIVTYLRLSDVAIKYYGAPSIARPLVGLLILAILYRWALTRRPPRGWLSAAGWVLGYGLVVFASLFYATDTTAASAAFSDFFKDGIITILVVALLQRKEDFRNTVWALILAGLFMGGVGVFQYLTGTFSNNYFGFGQAPLLNIVGATEGNRISGPIGDPNFFAQIMVVVVPLALNQLFAEKNILLKLLAGVTFALATLAVIFTFSRGGFLAMAVAVAVLALYRRPKLWEVLALILMAIILVRFVPNPFIDRLSTVTDMLTGQASVKEEVSFRGRASELIVAVRMFADHPILGVGVGNYPAYYQQYSRSVGLDPRTEARQAHNLFLEITSELGLVGILVFLLILAAVFRGVLRTYAYYKDRGDDYYASTVAAFGAALMGYFAAAMFIHGAYPRYLWLLVGIALALPQLVRRERDESALQPTLKEMNGR